MKIRFINAWPDMNLHGVINFFSIYCFHNRCGVMVLNFAVEISIRPIVGPENLEEAI